MRCSFFKLKTDNFQSCFYIKRFLWIYSAKTIKDIFSISQFLDNLPHCYRDKCLLGTFVNRELPVEGGLLILSNLLLLDIYRQIYECSLKDLTKGYVNLIVTGVYSLYI